MFYKIIDVFVYWLFPDFPRTVSNEQYEAARKDGVRNIVKNLSRGNNSLQQGRYMTEADLNKLREENDNYHFI
jgi:hypothetical protein